jgi:ribosome-binding protein aMBF1 (putative translation factor)
MERDKKIMYDWPTKTRRLVLERDEMKKLSELGLAIKRNRWQAMIKQKDLAKLVGCAPSFLSEIESGKKQPSLEMLWNLEKLIGPVWVRQDLK